METLLALMEGLKGAALSAVVPVFDWITFLVFLGSFGSRRFPQPVGKGIACYNWVGPGKFTASELCRCPNLSYNEDVLRERGIA